TTLFRSLRVRVRRIFKLSFLALRGERVVSNTCCRKFPGTFTTVLYAKSRPSLAWYWFQSRSSFPKRSGNCLNTRMPRVTIREIADLAGVSIATVSRVMNGHSDVAEE